MATKGITTKIKLDGEREYKEAVSQIASGLKVLDSELRMVSQSFAGNADSVEALSAKNDVLERQLLSQREKIDTLSQALEACARAYGESDKRTQKWQTALNNAKTEAMRTQQQIDKNTDALEKLDKQQKNLSKHTGETSGKMVGLGDVLDKLAEKAGIKLPDGLTKAANGLGQVNAKALAAAGVVGALIAALVKAEKALIDMTKASAEAAKNLTLLSQTTNLSIESAQEWDYTLKRVGSSLEQAQGDLSQLQEKMRDAAQGTGEGAELFGELGLSVQDATGHLKDTGTMLREVTEALAAMSDKSERNAIASALLGGTGEKLIPILNEGSDALGRYTQEAHEAGAVLDEQTVAALNRTADAMAKLDAATDAAKNQISGEFAPYLTEALEDVTGLVRNLGKAAKDSGIADVLGSMLTSVTSLLSTLGSMAKPVFDIITAGLMPIAMLMAAIADTADLIYSIFHLDWGGVKRSLGFGMSSGELSNMQKLMYKDQLTSSSYNADLGGWSGNWTPEPTYETARSVPPEELEDPEDPVNWVPTEEEKWQHGVYGGNAAGTDSWRGGWSWVGENGPELLRLPTGSQVMTAQESRAYGGDTYYITIDAKNIQEFEDIIRIVQTQRRRRRMEGG